MHEVTSQAKLRTGSQARSADFLAHKEGDTVAISVRDVSPGRSLVAYMDSGRELELTVHEVVPLGHKVALDEVRLGGEVTEYGVRVGIASKDIVSGQLVHVHNIRSARWTNGT